MAQYLTTGEDLTSIADAIRAKTGENSPLVYPTGFVTDIGKLCKYNWKGDNLTLISHILNENITLADTNFSNITPSTSTSVILPEGPLSDYKIYRPMVNEDLVMIYTLNTKFAYKSDYTPAGALDEQYEIYTLFASRRPTDINNLTYNNYFSALESHFLEFGIYFGSWGGRGIEWGNNIGVFMQASVGLSNQDLRDNDAVGITPRSPSIRFAASNNYMNTTACSNIDIENTSIHYTLDMYTCSNALASGQVSDVMNLYWADHPTNS